MWKERAHKTKFPLKPKDGELESKKVQETPKDR